MPTMTIYLGDGAGHGHDLRLIVQDDGTVVLLSHNPDTDELQRVVMLEDQWRLLLRVLLENFGKAKCCYFREDGLCAEDALAVGA